MSIVDSGPVSGARNLLGWLVGRLGQTLSAVSPDFHRRYASLLMRGPVRGAIRADLRRAVQRLEQGKPPLDVVEAVAADLNNALANGVFDRWLERPQSNTESTKRTLVRCDNYFPGRRWKLQIFYIPEGQSHPPHSHDDVASCLVVARGRIEAREYNRLRSLENGGETVMLERASEATLEPGDTLLTNDEYHNVHWFGAVDGPAVAFNFQVVGIARGKKPSEKLRSYVDPSADRGSGPFAATRMSKVDAHAKFAASRPRAFAARG